MNDESEKEIISSNEKKLKKYITTINIASAVGLVLIALASYAIYQQMGRASVVMGDTSNDFLYASVLVLVVTIVLVVGLFLRKRMAATLLFILYVANNIYNFKMGIIAPHQFVIPLIIAFWLFSGMVATFLYHKALKSSK